MNITFERPQAFYLLILLVPALFYLANNFMHFVQAFARRNRMGGNEHYYHHAKRCFVLRTLLRVIAYILLVFAISGISWGKKAVPIQKSGKAVTFVFDVSYSMEAKDGPDGCSRLESVVNYTENLLDHMEGVTVSAVIAKGAGVVAIPQTEDKESIYSLLASLSPKLISAEGTSLGGGINAAISSFAPQSSQANCIWVFTDGEETDSLLSSALNQALSYGIPVTIVGFGSESEIEVLTGDGENTVNTALRSSQIKKIVSEVNKRAFIHESVNNSCVMSFIDASEVGSANTLLKQVKSHGDSNESITYEIQSVAHYRLFIILALIFFAASFVAGEFTLRLHKKVFSFLTGALVISMLFTSCSGKFDDRMEILQGAINWNQKNYQKAVAEYLEVIERASQRDDTETLQYALFGLATTYLKQNEDNASLDRYKQIDASVNDAVKFALFYNMGVISCRKGDYQEASYLFREALLVDSTNVNAKINLELSLLQENVEADVKEQELTPVTTSNEDDHSLKNAIYSIIRENEQNQWKNQQQNTESSSLDY